MKLYTHWTADLLYSPLRPWQSPFFSVSMSLIILNIHTSGIMQYLSFCDQLISLKILSFWFIYSVTCGRISFFLKTEWYSLVYIHHFFFICSPVNEHLCCFHVLTIINNSAMDIWKLISLRSWFQFFSINIQKWDY